MSTLVVYDSVYGNTEKAAKLVSSRFPASTVLHAAKATAEDIASADTVIVGSPTHGGRPTEAVAAFLSGIPAGALKGKRVAAFDTRMSPDGQPWWLKAIIAFFGFAAPKIERVLLAKGGTKLQDAEGFIVEGKEGPLRKS